MQIRNLLIKFISTLIIFIIILGLACTTTKSPEVTPNLVWPLPPDKPRIKYIKSIYGENDFKPKRSKFIRLLLGEEEKRRFKDLLKPYGIAKDSQGILYVADTNARAVFSIDETNQKVKLIGSRSQVNLSSPIDLAIDQYDNIFVSDSIENKVFRFDTNGNLTLVIGTKGEFGRPTGLAINTLLSLLYIVDTKKHQVHIYKITGEYVKSVGQRGIGEGEFNFPTNIAFDPRGKIYIVDTGNYRVQVFDNEFNYITEFGKAGRHPGQFTRPKGVGVDSDGNVYVVDAAFNNIQVFSQKYQVLLHIGGYGIQIPGKFWLPAGIYIDDNNRIYVSDQQNHRVQVFQYLTDSK